MTMMARVLYLTFRVLTFPFWGPVKLLGLILVMALRPHVKPEADGLCGCLKMPHEEECILKTPIDGQHRLAAMKAANCLVGTKTGRMSGKDLDIKVKPVSQCHDEITVTPKDAAALLYDPVAPPLTFPYAKIRPTGHDKFHLTSGQFTSTLKTSQDTQKGWDGPADSIAWADELEKVGKSVVPKWRPSPQGCAAQAAIDALNTWEGQYPKVAQSHEKIRASFSKQQDTWRLRLRYACGHDMWADAILEGNTLTADFHIKKEGTIIASNALKNGVLKGLAPMSTQVRPSDLVKMRHTL